MQDHLASQIHQINYISAKMEAIYHQASQKIGMADSTSRVLYMICDYGGSCPLSYIYKQYGISKQTIHSAVAKLVDENIICLERQPGRAKMVFLTDYGRQYAQNTVNRLFEAEKQTFSTWTQAELDLYIQLMERYASDFQEQVSRL